MDGRGNPFTRSYSIGDSSKNKFPEDFISEERVVSNEEGSECLYPVAFEVVNHLRRHIRSYVKNIGGLKAIPELPRRKVSRKVPTYPKYSFLMGNLEELVNLSI